MSATGGGTPGGGENNWRVFISSDINHPVSIRIDRLDGLFPSSPTPSAFPLQDLDSCPDKKTPPELFVECSLYIDGAPFGLPATTRLESSGQPYCWNETLTLSTKYRDLTSHAQLAFTVWDVSNGSDNGPVGGATVFLFNNKKQLKAGRQKLRLWLKKEADGKIPTSTPGKVFCST